MKDKNTTLQNLFDEGMRRGAVISDCGKYRFKLWRIWDDNLPLCMFLMHNPSKADSYSNDPTTTRCIAFAKSWGYGGIYIGNLSPYRATNPDDMKGLSVEELCPLKNMGCINEMAAECEMHVLAYGNPVRNDIKPEIFDTRWHYLKLTKLGNPWHPLYLPKVATPIPIDFQTHSQTD